MRIEQIALTTGLLFAVSGCVDYGAEGYVATPVYAVPGYAAPGYGGIRSVDDFYAPLARYGRWVPTRWGQGWQPAVAPDWRPYTLGRWINDPGFGWTWASDEPWGWATYHYGRWGFDPALGWVWIPDTQWGPGWVAWRDGDDVTGWAPLPPQVSIAFGYSWNSWDYDRWYAPSWNWVPRQQFGHGGHYNYLPGDRGRDYWARSRDATRYDRDGDHVVNRGPGREANTRPLPPGQHQQPNTRPVAPAYGNGGGGNYRPDGRPHGYTQAPVYGATTPAPAGTGRSPAQPGWAPSSSGNVPPPGYAPRPPREAHLQEAAPHWDDTRAPPAAAGTTTARPVPAGATNERPVYHTAPQQYAPPPVVVAAPPAPPTASSERPHESRQQRDPGDHRPDPQ